MVKLRAEIYETSIDFLRAVFPGPVASMSVHRNLWRELGCPPVIEVEIRAVHPESPPQEEKLFDA
jgi:hypothetical protein